MEIEIKIGREVEGNSILLVPPTCKKVSRRHASLYWKDGAVIIEDNESANGTFVNGKRIAKTKVKENDIVWLGGVGGEGCYQMDMGKIFNSCREAENKNRTDYSREFISVKQAYLDYQREVAELKKKATTNTQMPKLVASFVPTVIGLVLMIVLEDPTVRILSISIGGVITGLINMLSVGKGSAVNEKISEEIVELQLKYQPRYCCPKCGMKFPFTTHWKKLEADGKCPNPKCNAQFVK